MENIFNGTYKNKTVLVTGHSGFKGAWLSFWLQALGANVIGYSLPPPTEPSLFEATGLVKRMVSITGDVRNRDRIEQVFKEYSPVFVFHLAAQPLVRCSYTDPVYTYETNVIGTLNILEAVRKTESVNSCLIITSDKCYENREWAFSYRENDSLGGFDPYSSSKACAELVTGSYRRSFFSGKANGDRKVAVSSARAGNVIGGGDWAADRIVPDTVKALTENKSILVRNPNAIRPWQHVLEPLSGYLWLAALMWIQGAKYSSAWNFGPSNSDTLTVGQLVDGIVKKWGCGDWIDASGNIGQQFHEAKILRLDCTKSQSLLGWTPVYSVVEAINNTIEWYRNFYTKPESSSYDFTLTQIQAYVDRAQKNGLLWAGEGDNNKS